MKAITLEKYGQPTVYGERPQPQCGPEQVLIAVHASSINPIDWKTADGQVKALVSYKLPLILGSDVSGKVLEVGAQVTRFSVGDEVYGRIDMHALGAYAEFAAVDQADLALKPERFSHAQAAGLPLVGLTAWQALVEKGDLQAGQKVLIHAGAGGVGNAAIQIAHSLGAFVATTASARNHALCQRLGADLTIDYRNERFEDHCEDYDLVFDTQGGETQARSWTVLKDGGLLVSINGIPDFCAARGAGAGLGLSIALEAANLPIKIRRAIQGLRFTYLFMHSSGEQLEQLSKLADEGKLEVAIDSTFPLEKVEDAFELSKKGRAQGKIIIEVQR